MSETTEERASGKGINFSHVQTGPNALEIGFIKAVAEKFGFDSVTLFTGFTTDRMGTLFAHFRFYGDEETADGNGLYKYLSENGMAFLESKGWSGDCDGTYYKVGVDLS